MPLTALKAVSKGQNGLSAFILQCSRLDFHYCDWAGSSRGMNAFIKHTLPKFATQNPAIEITVSPRPHRHPVVVCHYVNGQSRTVEAKNLEKLEILKKVTALRDANGEKERRVRRPVGSENESVRGVWSGLHGNGISLGWETKVRRD